MKDNLNYIFASVGIVTSWGLESIGCILGELFLVILEFATDFLRQESQVQAYPDQIRLGSVIAFLRVTVDDHLGAQAAHSW